jgi:hypothetical protein
MNSAEDDPEMSLYRHFSVIRDTTSGSHVVQFGTLDFISDSINEFLGVPEKKSSIVNISGDGYKKVNNRDVRLRYFMMKALRSGEYSQLNEEVQKSETVDSIINKFNHAFNIKKDDRVGKIDFQCLKESKRGFMNHCQWNEYAMKIGRNIGLACEKGITSKQIVNTFAKFCETK